MEQPRDIRDHTIVLAGTGRLASHWPAMLELAGLRVAYVYGRDPEAVSTLAARAGAFGITEAGELPAAEQLLVLLAVSDSSIFQVAGDLQGDRRTLVHCSGSVSSDNEQVAGVCYPLQTFSRDRTPDYQSIPFFITAENEAVQDLLKQLVMMINGKCRFIDDASRLRLHLAAVVVNNFTNHLVGLAEDFLQDGGLDYRDLLPLLQETAAKLVDLKPGEAQTGPAIRGDIKVIEQHLKLVENHTALHDVYEMMSRSILDKYGHH